jgi:alpha-D-xyloside xylohydrolase
MSDSKKIYITLVFLSVTSCLFSQTCHRIDGGLFGNALGMDITIRFYSSSIVRIVKRPTASVESKDMKSFVVQKLPEKVAVKYSKSESGTWILSSGEVEVIYNMHNGCISFNNQQGLSLLKEKEYGTQFTTSRDIDTTAYRVHQSFILEKNEPIYGLGQQQNGKINQRNQRNLLIQENTKICIPFFQSIKGYGVYWDNYSPTLFVDNAHELFFDSEISDGVDYYFINGGNADGVLAGVRNLTGEVPMFPLWTMGFWQSRERYKSQEELMDVVKKYRHLGIPFDGIIQDWQYWGSNGNWNSMRFDNPNFSNPQKMINFVHKNNAHLMISVWASFGCKTQQYQELNKDNMLLNITTWPMDSVKPYIPFYPKARDIYWKYLSGLYKMGIDGWWLDCTEPDHFGARVKDYNIPCYNGSFGKVRNAYPLMTVKGVYENQRRSEANQRVFIMTRSAFMGQQHYASSVWSGDVSASWDDFKAQIPAGLNFTICGNPYWNTDIGGFDPYQYPNGLNDPAYHELFVRWFQFGTFCPIMRSHKTGFPCEVYQFGEKGNWAYDVQLKYLRLRYRLLPYIYSICGDIHLHSGSMMRPLWMDYKNDSSTYNIADEYLFGKSILVKPITDSLYTKRTLTGTVVDMNVIKSKYIYLPSGNIWYDFWTNEMVSGGRKVLREVPIDIIPLYVKAGSILPMGPSVQYASEKKWDNLDLIVYPGAQGKFTLYEDENDNYNYEKGEFSTIDFLWNDKIGRFTIGERKGSFINMIKNRIFRIYIVARKQEGPLK